MKLSLIVPVFNEEQTIELFHQRVRSFFKDSVLCVEIVFVNDGSDDGTQALLDRLAEDDPCVTVLSFTRNFGKESALFAGLEHASGDAIIPIDVDLQDPIEVIPELIEKWRQGADVVLAKRIDRSADRRIKRKSAEWFYKLHNKISSPKLEENVGDFRLMSRDVVESIRAMPERNLFMKGVLSWVGGETATVDYVRAPRSAGKSKFDGWRLWNLALEGITSFSTFPLRMWTYIGFLVAAFALLYGSWMILEKLVWGNPVPGYPSLIVSILFLGGVQLVGIGVLGEYIGRIYVETKSRPRYILRKSKTRSNSPQPSNSAEAGVSPDDRS